MSYSGYNVAWDCGSDVLQSTSPFVLVSKCPNEVDMVVVDERALQSFPIMSCTDSREVVVYRSAMDPVFFE